MSLILDALNRSRQDAQSVPGLASQHLVDDAGQGASWLQWLLVVALAAAVLVIGWLLFDRALPPVAGESDGAAASMPVEVSRPATPSRAAAEGASAPPTAEPVAIPVTSAPAVAEKLAAPAPALPPPVEPVTARPEPGAADPGVAALYQQPRQDEPAPASPPTAQKQQAAAQPVSREPSARGREEEAIDIDKLVARAQEQLEDAKLQEHDVPLLATLSQQVKDAIPTLMYQRHDYSGDPAQSSVVINGKALRPGSSVAGVKVEEILPDSVVLSFQGHRFRLRALNSWVNL